MKTKLKIKSQIFDAIRPKLMILARLGDGYYWIWNTGSIKTKGTFLF